VACFPLKAHRADPARRHLPHRDSRGHRRTEKARKRPFETRFCAALCAQRKGKWRGSDPVSQPCRHLSSTRQTPMRHPPAPPALVLLRTSRFTARGQILNQTP
jgi:hypothetical protein